LRQLNSLIIILKRECFVNCFLLKIKKKEKKFEKTFLRLNFS